MISLVKRLFAKQPNNLVLIHAQHGLGNRLRAIASAASIAQAENKELAIIWEADEHCDCLMTDLFDYSGKLYSTLPAQLVAKAKQYNYMPLEEGAIKDELITLEDNKNTYIKSAYSLQHPGVSYDRDNQFLQQLTPSKAVADIVNSIDVSNCLGVHIRMEGGTGTDNHSYDSKELWGEEEHEKIQNWRDRSHFSAFSSVIDQTIAQEQLSGLFVATDLASTYESMKALHPKMKYLERQHFDRSKDQLVYALADAILLSQCESFLGSTWSSFSELAKRLSMGYKSAKMSADLNWTTRSLQFLVKPNKW